MQTLWCHFYKTHKAVTGLKNKICKYKGFFLLAECTLYHTLDTQKSMKPLFGHPVSKYWLRPCFTQCPQDIYRDFNSSMYLIYVYDCMCQFATLPCGYLPNILHLAQSSTNSQYSCIISNLTLRSLDICSTLLTDCT